VLVGELSEQLGTAQPHGGQVGLSGARCDHG
jgi:hypothetical protein